jgi:hypothetical protein
MLMFISCFAISVSAEGVNIAPKSTYSYVSESTYLSDDKSDAACKLLTDGVVSSFEKGGETVAYSGTGNEPTVLFDLGALYSDITAINFLGVCDSHTDNGGNRGFSLDDLLIIFYNGDDKSSDQEYTVDRVAIENAPTMYNYYVKFDAPVTAQSIKIRIKTPVYVLAISEIEIISTSGEGQEVVEPESSEEESLEESAEEPAESTDESVAESEAEESTEESKAEESKAEESKAEESKAEESKTESKVDTSSDNKDDKDGPDVLVIVIVIIVVVAVIATVVIIIMKKRG